MTLGHSLEMWGGPEIGTLSVMQCMGDDRNGKGRPPQDSGAD